jgi:hypothetical protein
MTAKQTKVAQTTTQALRDSICHYPRRAKASGMICILWGMTCLPEA